MFMGECPDETDVWLGQAEHYLARCGVNLQSQRAVLVVVSGLDGRAARWWYSMLPEEKATVTTFGVFCQRLLAHYGLDQAQEVARAEWRQLTRQPSTASLVELFKQYSTLMLRIPDMDSQTRAYGYLDALPVGLRQSVLRDWRPGQL